MVKNAKYIDFHRVEPHQVEVDRRLKNWAGWVIPRNPGWVSPMFRQYRSEEKLAQVEKRYRITCDVQDAWLVEKAVCHLPMHHRDAIRWAYVVRNTPSAPLRELGVERDTLARLLRDGRQMLVTTLSPGWQFAELRVYEGAV